MNLSLPELLLATLVIGGVVYYRMRDGRTGVTKESGKRFATAIFIAALLASLASVWRLYKLINHGQATAYLTRPETLTLIGIQTWAVALFGIGFWLYQREPVNR